MSRDEPKPRIDAADTELPADAAAVESSSMSEELGAGSVAQMEKRLEEANRKAEENWERFVRAQAEIENVRRRAEKDLQNAHKFALERFAKELLAVVDSLELGLQAAGANEANADGLREGMELTLKQLSSVLERFDVKPIDPAGERFNPEFHQAMATETDNEVEPNTVVRVFQKGYLLHDRLLRPALVVVAQRAPVSVGGEA
jgi:molecular chaperone GrpE